MLVSPAELRHPELAALGPSSSEPERYGADFMFPSPHGLVGIQRKEVRDLVSSLRDNRLQRELVMMEELDHALLIIEGDWQWHRGISNRTGLYYNEYRGLLLSLQIEHNLPVLLSDDCDETALILEHLEKWFSKADHGSLLRVSKPKTDKALHLLQYFPGVSLTRAKAIVAYFGRVPLRWDVDRESMMRVPGLGKVTVDKLFSILD